MKENNPLGAIRYTANSKYELIYGMDIQNYLQPEIKRFIVTNLMPSGLFHYLRIVIIDTDRKFQ